MRPRPLPPFDPDRILPSTPTPKQCLRSRSGVVAEAALVASNFLRFRRLEARWPLRLTAKEVAGGPLESGTHWILPVRGWRGVLYVVLFCFWG